jgi:hypothetical protein
MTQGANRNKEGFCGHSISNSVAGWLAHGQTHEWGWWFVPPLREEFNNLK